MQARLQQGTQQQDVAQLGQQTVPQNSQQISQPHHSSITQQTGLQPQVTVSAGVPNVNPSMHSVPQSVSDSGAVPLSLPQQQPSNQQFNTASLCFLGQEMVHEIVGKVQEMSQCLRTLNPPLGTLTSTTQSNEKRAKLLECFRYIKALFRKLRIIWQRCDENGQFQGMEYMHIESLIPVKEEWDMKTSEERKTSEAYRLASNECKELIDQVIIKNAQLKEIIDQLRRIVWEVNTMLTMIKS